MSKHTPGQWYWDFDRGGLAGLRSDFGDGEAIMIDIACYPEPADRRLIAAAPDLLKALEMLVLFSEPTKTNSVALHNARETIKRATTGESK